MDEQPAIIFHPFGTVTLNFDDLTIKLRRCRLGDLAFAKDLLAELQEKDRDERQGWFDEIESIRKLPEYEDPLSDKQREDLRTRLTRLQEVTQLLEDSRVEIVYGFLSEVAERMGDANPPPKDEWPLDMLIANLPGDMVNHWQTRPLASGKPSQNLNGAAEGIGSSPQSQDIPSSPPVQQPK